MATDNITIDPSKSNVVPRWATEATLEKLIKAVKDSKGITSEKDEPSEAEKKSQSTLNRIFDVILDGNEERSQEARDAARTAGQLNRATILNNRLTDAMFVLLKGMGRMLKNLGLGLLGLLKKIALGALIGAASIFRPGAIKDTFNGLLDSLKSMRLSGLASEAPAGQSGLSLLDGVRGLGIGLAKATELLTSYSYAVATTRGSFLGTVKEFRRLTDSGANLGMTIADSTQMLADEIEFRNTLIQGQRLSEEERARQANTLFESQMKYAKILGVSVDIIRKTSQSILKGSSNVQASLLMLGDDSEQVLTGLTEFTSGLTGMGFSDKFTSALVESATGITSLASEASRDYFTAAQIAGVDYFNTIERMNQAVEQGTLNQEQGAEFAAKLTSQLASVGRDGIFQLKVAAQMGNSAAGDFLEMINKARQARAAAAKLGGGDKVDETLRDLARFDNGISAIVENFNLFKQRLQLTLLPVISRLAAALGDPKSGIPAALQYAATAISDGLKGLLDAMGINALGEDQTQELGTQISTFIKTAGDKMKGFIDWITSYVKPLFAEDGGGKTALTEKFKNLGANIASAIWEGIKGALFNADFALIAGTIVVGVAGLAWVLNKFTGAGVVAGIAALVGLSYASSQLADAFIKWKAVDWSAVMKGMVAVAATLGSAFVLGKFMKSGGWVALAIGLAVLISPFAALAVGLGMVSLALKQFPWDSMTNFFTSLSDLSKIDTEKLKSVAGALGELAKAMGGFVSSLGFGTSLKEFLNIKTRSPLASMIDDLDRLATINTRDLINNLKIISNIQNGEPIKVEYINASAASAPAVMLTQPGTAVASATGAVGTTAAGTAAAPAQRNFAEEYSGQFRNMIDLMTKTNAKLDALPTLIGNQVHTR